VICPPLAALRGAVVPTVTNFGRNLTFRPAAVYTPRSEAEVLDILRTHRGRRIRAVGRLHSWSAAPVADDVLLDLRHLNDVRIHADGETPWVEVGAGCQVKRLVAELGRRGYTLPSLGLIDEQTVAGATATGTHGSGRHSLSHYVRAVRLAGYDNGEPVIREITEGADLWAARCSLGCLGIATAVRLPIRRQYRIEEHFRRYDRLEHLLEAEGKYPLQQFFLVPWRWDFFAQHRRETTDPPSRSTLLYRLFWLAGMDTALHLIIRALARSLPPAWTRRFFRHVLPRLVPMGWTVADRSDRQLTMQHELFRHIEIEIFVTRSRLAAAVPFVIWLLRHLGGEAVEPPPTVRERLGPERWAKLEALRGCHVHHYPICGRTVSPDDTLISMASGDEAAYALSFISYARPDGRDGFFRFAQALAESTAALFDARPHWGKVCPLPPAELARLYPGLTEFEAVRRRLDPTGVFRGEWMGSVLEAATPAPSPDRPPSR
jgi:FAD/FMN-containing dehydrogenase